MEATEGTGGLQGEPAKPVAAAVALGLLQSEELAAQAICWEHVIAGVSAGTAAAELLAMRVLVSVV